MKKIKREVQERTPGSHKSTHEVQLYTSVIPEGLKSAYYPVQIRTVQFNVFSFSIFPIPVKSKTTAKTWGQEKEKEGLNQRKKDVNQAIPSFTLQVQAGERREKQLQLTEFHSLGKINETGIF